MLFIQPRCCNEFGQLPDRQIDAAADIEKGGILSCLGIEGFVPHTHERNARIRHVFAIQELSARLACSPHHHFGNSAHFCLMHLPNQCRKHM